VLIIQRYLHYIIKLGNIQFLAFASILSFTFESVGAWILLVFSGGYAYLHLWKPLFTNKINIPSAPIYSCYLQGLLPRGFT